MGKKVREMPAIKKNIGVSPAIHARLVAALDQADPLKFEFGKPTIGEFTERAILESIEDLESRAPGKRKIAAGE